MRQRTKAISSAIRRINQTIISEPAILAAGLAFIKTLAKTRTLKIAAKRRAERKFKQNIAARAEKSALQIKRPSRRRDEAD